MKKLNRKQCNELAARTEAYEIAANAFNEARLALDSFREGLREEMSTHYEERSERWQEGDAGTAYEDWMEAWDEDVPDEAPDSCPEYPIEPEAA